MRWLQRLWSRFTRWLDHEDCKECEVILKLLQEHRVLLDTEMVAKEPKILDFGTVHVHLERLEGRGLVERCWGMRVGPGWARWSPGEGPHRYFYRLGDIA